jgi:hypothetical protein
MHLLLTNLLVSRLRSQQGWTVLPPSDTPAVCAPIVITGLPRSATTALHKLLLVDPSFQGLEHWLLTAPMPRPDRAAWGGQPGYTKAEKRLADLYSKSPKLKVAHEIVAAEADECSLLMAQDFCCNLFGSYVPVPTYDQWFLRSDLRPSYRRLASNLALVGHGDARRWVLKDPSHLLSLESLLDTFPDALVIQTHRDPREAIPSICGLYAHLRTYMEGCCSDPLYIGRRECAIWREALERAARVEEQYPNSFLHILYSDFVRDPISQVRRVYSHLGSSLSDRSELLMRSWLNQHPKDKHGSHQYVAEAFGLSEDTIRADFASYIDRIACL